MPTKYLELLEHLKTLKAEKARVSNEGIALVDCWIATSKPGGTARSTNAHWQLRSRKPQFAGKKSKYLKAAEIGEYEVAIARGKQLKQLEQQIKSLCQRISKIEAAIAVA
jgi:hypothetical protein